MHRFYVGSSLLPKSEIGARIDLPEDVSHQIRNVLRLKIGESFRLFSGDGREWTANLTPAVDRKRVSAELLSVTQPDVEMRTHVTMVMALNRPQRYEVALAKCTELGASEFRPMISERVLKSEATIGANRKERWCRIVTEAAELSGRVRLPEITEAAPMSTVLTDLSAQNTPIIFLWEGANGPMMSDILTELRNDDQPPNNLALVLGPVGGFSENEAMRANKKGAMLASLGPRILRTETAAIAAMSVVAQFLR
ncbi:MAG: 16S rRNA (uracil(1498)-N(3))-methyltransferase [Chloroflexi bacterium]|nr:16S rRNA (uracil(1498)-N(3))-methyltransferase [Chloroflexota bacterium]